MTLLSIQKQISKTVIHESIIQTQLLKLPSQTALPRHPSAALGGRRVRVAGGAASAARIRTLARGGEVGDGRLAAERARGAEPGPRHGPLAGVEEEHEGAVGEAERGQRGGLGHVGEAREVVGGLGQQEVVVGGEGLVVIGDSELGLD